MKLKDARVTATDLEPFGTDFWTCVCVGNQGSLQFSKVCTFSHADLLGAFDIKSELCYANCRAMIGKFVFNAYTSPERHAQLCLYLEERERGISDNSAFIPITMNLTLEHAQSQVNYPAFHCRVCQNKPCFKTQGADESIRNPAPSPTSETLHSE